MIFWICFAASVLAAAFTSVCGNLLHSGWDFWIPPVLTLGYLVGILFIFGLVTLIFSELIKIRKEIPVEKRFYRVYMERTLELLMTVLRVRCRVTGKEKLPAGRFLFVSNHLSMFDPMVCIAMLRGTKISYVSKPENFKIPVAGAFMKRCRFLAIDRENARNAVRTINAAVEMLESDQCSIGIYPEGTRSKTGILQEFHHGSFKIALKAKVPIVVATVRNTEKICKNFPLRGTKVKISIIGVIQPEEYAGKNTAEISDEVFRMMQSDLQR